MIQGFVQQDSDFVGLELPLIAIDSGEPSLDLEFQVCSRADNTVVYELLCDQCPDLWEL